MYFTIEREKHKILKHYTNLQLSVTSNNYVLTSGINSVVLDYEVFSVNR